MTISFGKFIPVKVFIDEKEIKNSNVLVVPKEVERTTLSFCDCLAKNEKYPDSLLAQQQRMFFASKVKDYVIPRKVSVSKSEITPSSVKTVNLDGKRYLVTGADIERVNEIGHNFGKAKKENYNFAEDYVAKRAEGMSYNSFNCEVSRVAKTYNQSAKEERLNALRSLVKRNSIDETLCIYAQTNKNAKLVRDRYSIQLINFEA